MNTQESALSSRYAQVNGIRVHYLTQGKNSGPLLLLLHGFPEYSGKWRPYLEALSDHYQVVAPDLRGYNLTDQPKDIAAYDMVPTLADDIVGLVRALGGRTAYLAGHDWGGVLSWFLADRHPDIFTKVVICNAPHPRVTRFLLTDDPLQQKMVAAYFPMLAAPTGEDYVSRDQFGWCRRAFFEQTTAPLSADEKAGYLEVWGRGMSGGLAYYRNAMKNGGRFADTMRGISVPVKVIWGLNDQAMAPRNLEGLDQHVKNLEIVRYPQGTHWLNREYTAEIIQHMRSFFV